MQTAAVIKSVMSMMIMTALPTMVTVAIIYNIIWNVHP